MSSPAPTVGMPLRHRLMHALVQLLSQAWRQAQRHMPPYAGPVALSFAIGCGAAALYMQSGRRRWSAQQMRMHRATASGDTHSAHTICNSELLQQHAPVDSQSLTLAAAPSCGPCASLLKDVCRECWDEVDAECLGWLEVSEARAVLDRVLLVLASRTAQLAAMIAPPPTLTDPGAAVVAAGASNDASPSSGASSSSSAAAASASAASVLASSASWLPASPDVEAEVRASLSRLFPALRRHLAREFKFLLEHIEARPPSTAAGGKAAIKGFTPPATQGSPSGSAGGASGLSAAVAAQLHLQHQQQQHRKVSTASNGSQGSHGSQGSAGANGSLASFGSGTTVQSHSQSQSAESPRLQNGHAAASAAAAAASPSPAAAMDSAAASASASSSSSQLLSGRSSSSDRRIFRCEFNTAVVLWIEAQMQMQAAITGTQTDSSSEMREGAG